MTYRCDIVKELAQESDYVVHVLVPLDEAQALAPRQFADNIECEELQPFTKIAALARLCENLLCLVQPKCEGRIDKRFVVDERAHRESIVNASAVLCVEIFVGRGEQRVEWSALRDRSLYGVEI